MIAWRIGRALAYKAIGTVRPGWTHALPLLLARDRYADLGTMNVALHGDLRFDSNLRAMDAEIKRLRRGEPPRPFDLPHDFPPGIRDDLRARFGVGAGTSPD